MAEPYSLTELDELRVALGGRGVFSSEFICVDRWLATIAERDKRIEHIHAGLSHWISIAVDDNSLDDKNKFQMLVRFNDAVERTFL